MTVLVENFSLENGASHQVYKDVLFTAIQNIKARIAEDKAKKGELKFSDEMLTCYPFGHTYYTRVENVLYTLHHYINLMDKSGKDEYELSVQYS